MPSLCSNKQVYTQYIIHTVYNVHFCSVFKYMVYNMKLSFKKIYMEAWQKITHDT